MSAVRRPLSGEELLLAVTEAMVLSHPRYHRIARLRGDAIAPSPIV
jgi:hypothetical protein